LAEIKKSLSSKANDRTAGKMNLEEKANELNIKFRPNIGNEKLLAKIQEIEPDFKI